MLDTETQINIENILPKGDIICPKICVKPGTISLMLSETEDLLNQRIVKSVELQIGGKKDQ